ncbi:MAG: PEGA domain-containing protein [Patescibacteria group bacterium]
MKTFLLWRRRLGRFPSFWPLIFISLGTLAVILYGRGYRPNFKDKDLKATGLMATTSDPQGAQVFIDGKLTTATNNPVNIDPGWYAVKISKEGYIPWEKRLRVQGEVVVRADAFLFPSSPSLSPLTLSGIDNPLLSPDGTKIAYTIPPTNTLVTGKKPGLWVYDLAERPLGFNRDPRQIGESSTLLDFSQITLTWSPDSTQLLVENGPVKRLYNVARVGDFQNVSTTAMGIRTLWEEEHRQKERQQLAAFKQPIIDVATSSANILSFSPDETKILYEATASAILPQVMLPALIGTNPTEEQRAIVPGKLYVYDSREDKNFFVLDKKELPLPTTSPSQSPSSRLRAPAPYPQLTTYNLPASPAGRQPTTNIHWFPTSRHLVVAFPGKIDIMEYDRTNWVTVYAGPFVEGFIASWPTGSRLIVMVNLNPNASKLPNLYTVNLR